METISNSSASPWSGKATWNSLSGNISYNGTVRKGMKDERDRRRERVSEPGKRKEEKRGGSTPIW